MKTVLPRVQSLALLQQHYHQYSDAEVAPLAEALGDVELAVKISTQFLQQYGKRRFTEPQTFVAELYQLPPPETVYSDSNIDQDLGFRLNNLGRILQDYLQLPLARQIFELAVVIDEHHYGPGHPNVARDMNRLGTVYHDLGDWQNARQLYTKAMRIDEDYYGAEHPNVARDINNIAILLRDSGDLQKAYDLFYHAYTICNKALGEEHPYTQIVTQHLMQLESEF